MHPNPAFVSEFRTLFKSGATVSALVRAIAGRWTGGAVRVDTFVRAHFREAFHIPMLLIGAEQVEQIARGDELAAFNDRIPPRMRATQHEWDAPNPASAVPQARAG
ncbi:hypothetical protein [Gemmata sp.]|uniref:hypothetical protein n=1 Tax=Gemmata sp. TaxID=1914242 RepID=UPI003F7065B8